MQTAISGARPAWPTRASEEESAATGDIISQRPSNARLPTESKPPTIAPVSDASRTESSAVATYRSWVDRMLEGFRTDPERIVIRDPARGVSGGQFATMVDRYAHALAARGLGSGHRVALLATESAEALAVRYAVALVGAASVFTPDTGRPERLVRFLKQVRPRLLMVFPETAPHAVGRIVLQADHRQTFLSAAFLDDRSIDSERHG